MNRRRLLWLGIPRTVIGGIVAAWFVFAERDADGHVIGPKTRGVRLNLALLDSKIDVADFRDCTTVRQVLRRLNRKLQDEPRPFGEDAFVFGHEVTLDRAIPMNLDASPVRISAECRPVALKQFLREIFGGADAADVQFIVSPHSIWVTNLPTARQEQANYLDNTSVFDRLRQTWKDLTGDVAEDPITLDVL